MTIPDPIKQQLEAHQEAVDLILDTRLDIIRQMADAVLTTLDDAGKIILFGNGGSAADAQHMAAELVGRFQRKRDALPALALTTDTSALTAIANDFGYRHVFRRQLAGLGAMNDCCIGLSTSGMSENVNTAMAYAQACGMMTIGFTGEHGGDLEQYCEMVFKVPHCDTPRIQECHMLVLHILCDLIDARVSP